VRVESVKLLNLLQSKLFLVIVFALVCLLGWVNFQQHRQSFKQELAQKQQSLKQARLKNEQLKQLRDYYNTEVFLEREARRKLNQQKPGEQVMIIARDNKSSQQQEQEQVPKQVSKINKFKNWLSVFFN